MTIFGGQEINGDRPAVLSGRGQQTVTVWVSFRFESNGELVMPFLTKAVEASSRIVIELGAM